MIGKAYFGRTGHLSTRTLFGGAAFGGVTQEEADWVLEALLRFGVNHIDTAAGYGASEERIGPWMARHRDGFFLATKTGQRTRQEAREELQRSLKRLQVEQVDLIQLHGLTDPDEWETAMGPGGALEACTEAREQGWVRFIGVTGHGTTAAAMHRRSLERFDFDSVLLPYNYPMMQNPQYAADFEELYTLCRERNVAMQTIKSIARGPWGETPRTRATWYEPLEAQDEIDAAVHWVLSRPDIFLNTVGDIHLLPRVLDAANRFESAAASELASTRLKDLELEPLFT